MTKLTNKAALEAAMFALTYLTEHGENASIHFSNADITEKLNGMVAQLDKRAAAPKPMTKTQKENVGLKEIVMDVLLDAGKAVTVSEIQSMDERLSPAVMANQKVSALLRQLVAEGKVVKETANRKTVFRAA